MRGIAAEAAVDQALVAHFFGGKQALFVEVVRLPFEPSQVLPLLLEGDRETVGERLARFVASILESPEGQIVGMVMARHVIEVEPLAALSADELADLLAPTLQRYLVGELRRS
jgi:AcrR family transcriptional regulator